MSTTSDTASAASPALAYAFVIGLTAASWYGLWRYARPAIQSQAGRPTRMTRDRRLRTIAFSVLVMIYPLMFTAGCVMMAFQPTGDTGIWTANLMVWAMAAALITAPPGLHGWQHRRVLRRRRGRHRRRRAVVPAAEATRRALRVLGSPTPQAGLHNWRSRLSGNTTSLDGGTHWPVVWPVRVDSVRQRAVRRPTPVSARRGRRLMRTFLAALPSPATGPGSRWFVAVR